jgi:hypothetical protein
LTIGKQDLVGLVVIRNEDIIDAIAVEVALGERRGRGDGQVVPTRDVSTRIPTTFTSTLLPRSDGSYGATVGDFKGDGIDDVFVWNYNQANEVLLNNGQGVPGAMVLDRFGYVTPGTLGFTSTLLPRSDDSYGATVGDFNGDGIDDVFVANFNQANEVLLADGQGGFTSTLLPRSDNSRGAIKGDFNGDGIDDVFVANDNQANEHAWYDPCDDDGYYFRDALGERGCYACPRHTTDTRHAMTMCELCPAGRIGPEGGSAFTHDQRFFCIPCEAGTARGLTETECATCATGLFANAGAPSCEPCQPTSYKHRWGRRD